MLKFLFYVAATVVSLFVDAFILKWLVADTNIVKLSYWQCFDLAAVALIFVKGHVLKALREAKK